MHCFHFCIQCLHSTVRQLQNLSAGFSSRYLHELHPGRDSLSCDLIEEFRAPFVDRFVLTLINRKQVTQKDFESVSGNIQLKEMAKRKILTEWENSKNEKVPFPLYKKDVQRKLIPVFAGAVTRAIYSWRYSGISAIHLGGGLTVFILLSYDIADSPERLRKVAKICENYGVRVQKSVLNSISAWQILCN